MALDNATIYLLVGLALALLVIAAVGSQQIGAALVVLGMIALPFIGLGAVIYLAIKHGLRNGRQDN